MRSFLFRRCLHCLSEPHRACTCPVLLPPCSVFHRVFVHSKCSVPSPCVGQFFSCLPMYFSTSSADGTLLDYNLRLFCFCFDERRRSLEFCSSISAVRLFALVLCLPSRTCMVGFVVIRFTVYAFNRLLPCKLEVWEWVVKRRIFEPFTEFSGWFSSCLILLCICIYSPSGWASVMVFPLPCSGVMLCSIYPLTIPGRRYPDCPASSFRRHPASKQLSKQLHLFKHPSNT